MFIPELRQPATHNPWYHSRYLLYPQTLLSLFHCHIGIPNDQNLKARPKLWRNKNNLFLEYSCGSNSLILTYIIFVPDHISVLLRLPSAASQTSVKLFNRIMREVAYMRPLKLQASLRAHDLMRKHELVDVGHRLGKVSVLATLRGNFYSRKLEWTSNADRLKFHSWSALIDMHLIGWAIVIFVCS